MIGFFKKRFMHSESFLRKKLANKIKLSLLKKFKNMRIVSDAKTKSGIMVD